MSAYARVAVARSSGGWTVSGNDAALAAIITFPRASTGSQTATHFGVGRASSGTGQLVFFGAISPNILITNGVAPQLDTGTKVSQTTPDGMANGAATDFLKLFFQNTAWANIGDASGLQPSGSAGNLYVSLHTASPGEAGDQTTNECNYT